MKIRESGMPEEKLWSSFFDPEAILDNLVFGPPAVAVEFGCGFGTFTIPAARQTTLSFHAFDIDPEMLTATSNKVPSAGLGHLRVTLRDLVADWTGLPDESADYAMLFKSQHLEDPHLPPERLDEFSARRGGSG